MISEVGGYDRRGRFVGKERVVRELVREEVIGPLKKVKRGKTKGLNGTKVEMLKSGGISIVD